MPRCAVRCSGQARDVAPLEEDRTAGRRQVAAQQIEEGCLAGAVGTDDRVQRTRPHLNAYIVHGDQRAELSAQIARFQNDVGGRCIGRHTLLQMGSEGGTAEAVVPPSGFSQTLTGACMAPIRRSGCRPADRRSDPAGLPAAGRARRAGSSRPHSKYRNSGSSTLSRVTMYMSWMATWSSGRM